MPFNAATASRPAIEIEEDLHLVHEYLAILHALAGAEDALPLPGCALLLLTLPALESAERLLRDAQGAELTG
jgi:hypothetical protein